MVRKAALAIALATSPATAFAQEVESAQDANTPLWEYTSQTGSLFSVSWPDIVSAEPFEAWLAGDHSEDGTVTYRSSLTLIKLNCQGGAAVMARTTYDPDGSVASSFDTAIVEYSPIRPRTMVADLEANFCT